MGESLKGRFKKLPPWMTILVIGVSLGVTVYWTFRYEGLYRLLAEFQIRHFGSYYVVLTFVFTLMGAFVVLVLPLRLLLSLFSSGEVWEAPFNARSLEGESEGRLGFKILRGIKFLSGNRLLTIAIVLFLFGLFYGGAQFLLGVMTGPLKRVDLSQLYAGAEPEGRYVEMAGRLLLSKTVRVEEGEGSRKVGTDFTPFVPSDWPAAEGDSLKGEVWVIMEPQNGTIPEEMAVGGEVRTLQGLLSHRLSGFPIHLLREEGLNVPEGVWLFEEGVSPKSLKSEGMPLMIAGPAAGVFLGGLWYLLNRRRLQKEKPE